MMNNIFNQPLRQNDDGIQKIQQSLKEMMLKNPRKFHQSSEDQVANEMTKMMQKRKIINPFEIQEFQKANENKNFFQNLSSVASNVIRPQIDDLLVFENGGIRDQKDFRANLKNQFSQSFGMNNSFANNLIDNRHHKQAQLSIQRQKNPLFRADVDIQPRKDKKKLIWQLGQINPAQKDKINQDQDYLQQIQAEEQLQRMYIFKKPIQPHNGSVSYNQTPDQATDRIIKLGIDTITLKVEVILDKRLLQTFEINASPDTKVQAIKKNIIKRMQKIIQFNKGDTIILLNSRKILHNDKTLKQLNINDKNGIIEFNICSESKSFDDIRNKMLFGNDYEDEPLQNQYGQDNNLDDNALIREGEDQQENQAYDDYKPILSDKYIYYPPVEVIMSMSRQQLKQVNLIITRRQYGRIQFLVPVDLTFVNIEDCVDIGEGYIEVYNDDLYGEEKPQLGQKLNQPACLTYFKRLGDGETKEEFEENVRQMVDLNKKIKLIQLDLTEMTVVYQVPGW